MTTEEQTIPQKITELESCYQIAVHNSDFLFAKSILERIEWLQTILNRN